jgi:hypothetical protein
MKEDTMHKLQLFQAAAREGGFVEVNKAANGTVLWLKKSPPDKAQGTPVRMCIDSLTNSATVFWKTVPGKLNSRTFRSVPALQEWIELKPETSLNRRMNKRFSPRSQS